MTPNMIRLSSALVGAMLLAAECVSVPDTREGTLEVIATDLTGQRIADVQVELFPGESRIAEFTTSSTTVRVQYGNYRMRVYAKGFGAKWRDIRISQPETFVQVELPVGHIGCPPAPATIGGRIHMDGSNQDVWIKVIPVRGTGGGESRVSRSGDFLVSGLEHSTFLVLVMKETEVLHHQVVKTYPASADTSKLSIDIRR